MQRKTSTVLILATLSFCGFSAQAQADFRPGYLVRPAGDTVRGEVDYRDARFSGTRCRFRPSPEAPVTVFQPTDLRAYGLRDESRAYRALVPPITAPVVSASPAPARPYFLEVLADGPATLYYLRDDDRVDHYYVATETFPLTELVHRKVRTQDGVMAEQSTYRITLAQALASCPSAQLQLPALPFTALALTKAVAAYNTCRLPAGSAPAAPLAPAPRQRSGPRARVGLVLGLKQTRMLVSYPGYAANNVNLHYGPDYAPMGGLALGVPLTQLSRKLSLEVELLYESQRYSQNLEEQPGSTKHYEFDMPTLRLPLLVRYTFPKGRVRPFVEGGATGAYGVKLTSTEAEVLAGGTTGPTTDFLQLNSQRFILGFGGGGGVQFACGQGRQAAVLVRYEQDGGWATGVGLATSTQHLYATFTVDLFK